MLAILQMSDTPQIFQTAEMLRAAGYTEFMLCSQDLRTELEKVGCDTIISYERMISLGYEKLPREYKQATIKDMDRCDLFVAIKVRNIPKIINRWPRLEKKIIWWRVNGSQPEICPKGGDEVNLPCPIVTGCFWYGTERYCRDENSESVWQDNLAQMDMVNNPPPEVSPQQLLDHSNNVTKGAYGMAYTFWPSYPGSKKFDSVNRMGLQKFLPPYFLCHNPYAWGYGEIIDKLSDSTGLRVFGNGGMAGILQHTELPKVTAKATALVHLKVVDCPGWALYEAMLSGCPVITGRLLNSRMLAYDLLEDGITCFEFGVPASHDYGRGDIEIDKCYDDIKKALVKLENPQINYEIGQTGKARLNHLMWNSEKDGEAFKAFMERWIV